MPSMHMVQSFSCLWWSRQLHFDNSWLATQRCLQLGWHVVPQDFLFVSSLHEDQVSCFDEFHLMGVLEEREHLTLVWTGRLLDVQFPGSWGLITQSLCFPLVLLTPYHINCWISSTGVWRFRHTHKIKSAMGASFGDTADDSMGIDFLLS